MVVLLVRLVVLKVIDIRMKFPCFPLLSIVCESVRDPIHVKSSFRSQDYVSEKETKKRRKHEMREGSNIQTAQHLKLHSTSQERVVATVEHRPQSLCIIMDNINGAIRGVVFVGCSLISLKAAHLSLQAENVNCVNVHS